MIEASFGGTSRAASIAGAYQYDTGQRLVMHGLPTPQAFSAADDFLSGSLAAVEVHFSRPGDSQAQMRLAIWNEARGVWLCAVPDELLSRSEAVQVHVYVYHGEDGETVRGKTAYEGVFTPIARPAPYGLTTPEQDEAWVQKQEEISLALTACEKATGSAADAVSGAQQAASDAQAPAQQAQQAKDAAALSTDRLYELEDAWGRAQIAVSSLAPGAKATAALQYAQDGRVQIALGIPCGESGVQGAQGEAGPTDVTFYLDGTTLTITTA